MIRASRSLAVSALAVSGALHVAGVSVFWTQEQVEMEGGAPASVARLGNSFQDVAQGTQFPEAPEDALDAEQIETVEAQERPEETQEPVRTDSIEKQERPEDVQEPASVLSELAQASPVRIASAPTVELDNPVQAAPVRETTKPIQAIRPERRETGISAEPEPQQAEAPEPDVIAALPQDGNETAPVLSSRPRTRPEGLAPPEPKRATASRQGSNQPEQVRGSTDGQREATQTQRSQRQSTEASQAGNAAASNYPGLVQRQIFRQRRPSVSSRGTATISFEIAPSGALARIGVARSSGSQALDAAAVQLVRRAAPFPAPPPGARRSFTIGIQGR